jgi:acetamidase/formamidase
VTFRTLEPDTWGFTNAGGRTNRLYRRLRLDGVDQVSLLWTIDATKGFASNQYGHQVPLNPFLGVVGVGLPEGEHSTIPPRALGGGNIDCKDLIAGSTLFLPIQTGGAMLYVGDGHGAQGDGEVGGSAMECGMTTEMVLDVIDAGPIDSIHAVTPTSRITFGFDEDLNEAMASALDAMVKWMSETLGLESAAALALASCTVDLRVTQVANDTWGVHAALPNERITMDDRGDRAADA